MTFIPKERSDIWHGFPLRDLNEANSIFLQAISQIAGVHQAIIGDRRGDWLGAHVGANWDKEQARALVLQTAQLLAESERRRPTREMEIRLAQGCLFVRGLGNAFALVVCATNVDAAMLRMTLNVAAATYEANTVLQNLIRVASESRLGANVPRTEDDSNMWAKFP